MANTHVPPMVGVALKATARFLDHKDILQSTGWKQAACYPAVSAQSRSFTETCPWSVGITLLKEVGNVCIEKLQLSPSQPPPPPLGGGGSGLEAMHQDHLSCRRRPAAAPELQLQLHSRLELDYISPESSFSPFLVTPDVNGQAWPLCKPMGREL